MEAVEEEEGRTDPENPWVWLTSYSRIPVSIHGHGGVRGGGGGYILSPFTSSRVPPLKLKSIFPPRQPNSYPPPAANHRAQVRRWVIAAAPETWVFLRLLWLLLLLSLSEVVAAVAPFAESSLGFCGLCCHCSCSCCCKSFFFCCCWNACRTLLLLFLSAAKLSKLLLGWPTFSFNFFSR